MKDNKLIAEFMDWKLQDNPKERWHNSYRTSNGILHKNTNTDPLLFHSSWDWLMPVVSKIGNIKNYGINGTLDWLSESEFNIEQERDGLYTIEDVFLSVVEFVKRTT